MSYALPIASAALALAALVSSASEPAPPAELPLPGVTVSTHVALGLFAATAPVIETVHFDAGAPSENGWIEGTQTVLSSRSNVSVAVAVAEIAGCPRGDADDDDDGGSGIQWSADGGEHWHDLGDRATSIVGRAGPGDHAAAWTVRYRRRASSDAAACSPRVMFTAVPAR